MAYKKKRWPQKRAPLSHLRTWPESFYSQRLRTRDWHLVSTEFDSHSGLHFCSSAVMAKLVDAPDLGSGGTLLEQGPWGFDSPSPHHTKSMVTFTPDYVNRIILLDAILALGIKLFI